MSGEPRVESGEAKAENRQRRADRGESRPLNPQGSTLKPRDCRLWTFVVFSTVVIAVLTLVGVHCPARIKLLGLFAVVYGLIAGWALSKAADLTGMHFHVVAVVLSVLFIAGGQVAMAWQSHRLRAANLKEIYTARPEMVLAGQFGDAAKSGKDNFKAQSRATAQLTAKLRRQRREELARKTSFPAYLRHRLAALGSPPSPWPELFWGTEILLACAAGGWWVWQAVPREEPSQ